jgi:hypothetical protein
VRDDWIALSTDVSAPTTGAASPAATPGAAAAASPAAAAVAPAPVAPSATAGEKPSVPAAAPAPPAKDGDEIYRSTAERLRALEKLRKDGLITEAEYQEKRRQILRDL